VKGAPSPRQRVIVALDVPDLARLGELLDRLDGRPQMYKVGLELFVAEGEHAVEMVKKRGGGIFLDLKLHDIPETVAGAVASAARIGIDLLTVHTSGGYQMMSRAAEAAGDQVEILGVTVLTSLAEDDLRDEGIPGSITDVVQARARVAKRAGIRGLVCSAHEVAAVHAVAPEMDLVVPGIRPAGAGHGDQKRVATATEAVRSGAKFVVVGRPIRQAPNPAEAFEALVREVEAASGP
jgi:orotidine-5'-phosphate decarboxylase